MARVTTRYRSGVVAVASPICHSTYHGQWLALLATTIALALDALAHPSALNFAADAASHGAARARGDECCPWCLYGRLQGDCRQEIGLLV